MSLSPFPVITFEIRVTVEFVAQTLCVHWFECGCVNTLRAIELVHERSHAFPSAHNKP
jgi:hypothetical protein